MAWTDTYNGFNSTTRNLYDRYSGYRNGNAWSQVSTGNRGEYQWKAGSGSSAFYLSPQEYSQYDGWYRQEQDFKRQQQEQQRQQELQRQQEAQRQQELQRQQQEAQRQQELQRQQQEVLRQQQWQQEQQRQQEEQRRAAASFAPPPPLATLPTAPTAPTAPVFTPSTAPVTNPAPSQYTPSARLSELDKVTSLDSFDPKDAEEAAYVLQKHLASLSQTTKGLYDTYTRGLSNQWPWQKRVEGGKTYYTTGYGYDTEVLSEADFLNFQKLDKIVQDKYSAALPAAQKKDDGVISSAGAAQEPYSVQKSISGLLSGTEKSASILNQEYAKALDAYRQSRTTEASFLAEAQASRDRQQTLAEYEAATTKRRRKETDLVNQLAQDRLNRRAVIEKRKLQGGLARASSLSKRLSGSSFFGSVS